MRIMLMCFIGALVFGVSLVDEAKADLLWHLEFEGNLDDTAGHASGPYNGAEVAPPMGGGSTAFVPDGRVGQALEFDGSTVRVDVPGTATAMSEFTISLFMKSEETWYMNAYHLVSQPFWEASGNFQFRSLPNDDIDMQYTAGNSGIYVPVGTFGPSDIGRWIHMAVTFSESAAVTKLYFDGVEAFSTAVASGDAVEWDDGFTLGAWNRPTG